MATLNTLAIVLTANNAQLVRTLRESGAEVKGFQATVEGTGGKGAAAFKVLGVGITTAAVGLAYAATQAAQFQKEMLNVTTIDGQVRASLAQTSAQVLDLSKHLPQSAKELAAGLYDISSSGFQGANSLGILKVSATAASAGLSTTANAAKAITATLNAYGLKASDAARVSDALFQTVNFGVVDFDQLTAVIGDTVGTAAAAGVNIEQLGSAIATLTLSGLSASEAGTSLNRVLTSLIKPNQNLLEVQKRLGVSFTEELRDPSIGLKGVLDQLLQSVDGNKTAFSNLFTDIRASRGVLALEANDGKNYTRVLQSMGIASDNTGATQKALAQQAKGVSFQLQILKNDFNAAAITVGTKVLPVLTTLIGDAGRVGQSIGHDLVGAAAALAPLWANLAGIGKDLGTIFQGLDQSFGPLAADLAKVAGVAAAATLIGISTAAKDVSGALADSRTAVISLVIALGLLKYQAIAAGFATIGSAALDAFSFIYLRGASAVTAVARLGGATDVSTAAALRNAAAADAAASATARLAADAAIAATVIREEAQGELFAVSAAGELLTVTNAAAAAQAELSIAVDGALVSYTEAEAAAVAYAGTLEAQAVAASEAAAASSAAAASTVGLGRGFATGLLKGGVIAAGVVGIAYGINLITQHAKEALPAVDELTNAFSKGDEAAKIKAFIDSLSGSSSGDNRRESVLEFLQRYKISLADVYQAVSSGDTHAVDNIILKIGKLGNVQGDTNSKVQGSARISADTYGQIRKVLEDLTHQYGGTQAAVDALSAALGAVPAKTAAQIAADKAYAQAQKDLGVALKGNSPSTINLASANVQLAKAQQNSANSAKLLTDAQRAFDAGGADVNKTLNDQIDFFKGVADQSTVTKDTLLKNAQDSVTAFVNETANIQTIQANAAKAGLSADQTAGLISGLVKQGPQTVAAAAQLSLSEIQKYGGLEVQSIQAKERDKLAILKATEPELYQQIQVAARQHQTDVENAYKATITDQVAVALDRAGKLLDGFGSSANPRVADKINANKQLALQAFLNTLPEPIRQAVAIALPEVEKGANDVTQKILFALISAQPTSAAASLKLVQGVQGELNKLTPKEVQVILDDLASGKVPAILQALGMLQDAILKLPAGVAIGVPQDPLANVLKPPGAATGGNPFSGLVRGGTSMRGDKNLIAVSPLEYVVQGPAAMMYGRAAMDSVNRGTAEIIPHFATGGPVGDRYSYNLTTAPLASSLEQYAKRVEAKLGEVQQTIAAAVSAGGEGTPGAKAYALSRLAAYGWGSDQFAPLNSLWNRESGWNVYARNPDSGAYGIPQSLPAEKMASAGADWRSNYATQETWGLGYIKAVYGSPSAAWAHSQATGWYATGGSTDPAVDAYLKALRDQANVNAYLSALNKGKSGGSSSPSLLSFLASATKLAPGAHDLAVRGLQDAYGMPTRTGTWDQRTTDFLAVNSPHLGARSDAIRYLQLAIKRPATGVLTSADLPQLGRVVNAVGFPNGDTTFGALIHGDANQTAFQSYLQTIIRRGFAPLAGYLNQQGADTALAGARQLAGAPLATLQRANAAAIRQSSTSKFGDALTLAQQLASYGGKVGLLGLASRSGTSVADVLGLVTSYPDVFSAVGSSGKLLAADLKRIAAGLQPVAAYASGAWEIKQDHVATVHKGETVLPEQYAEPWRQHAAGGRNGGGGIALTFEAGAIPVTVGDVASMGQVRSEVKRAIGDSLGTLISRALSRTGSR